MELKANVLKAGVSLSDLNNLVEKWGDSVTSLLNEALEEGLSIHFVKQLLDTFGPWFLNFSIMTKKMQSKVKMTSATVDGFTHHPHEDDEECPGAHVCDHVPTCLGSPFKGPIHVAEQVVPPVVTSPLADLFSSLLVRLLPELVQQYGPQLLDALSKALISVLTEDKEKLRVLLAATLDK